MHVCKPFRWETPRGCEHTQWSPASLHTSVLQYWNPGLDYLKLHMLAFHQSTSNSVSGFRAFLEAAWEMLIGECVPEAQLQSGLVDVEQQCVASSSLCIYITLVTLYHWSKVNILTYITYCLGTFMYFCCWCCYCNLIPSGNVQRQHFLKNKSSLKYNCFCMGQ